MRTSVMTSNKVATPFRPINVEFIDLASKEHFDIYYKAELSGEPTYVKFASSRPEHYEDVCAMMSSGKCGDTFYIREEDLFKYYHHATESLRTIVTSPAVPTPVKVKKVYEVSKGVMTEFFEYNTSSKILQSSDEVMEIMDNCMASTDVGFATISRVTSRDYYTYTHSVNVGLYCMTFGVKCKMPKTVIKELGIGGMLHDVGKAELDPELINKNGKLTEEEFQIIQKHPVLGMSLLEKIGRYSPCVIHMAEQHHEKYNGGGYPKGLAADDISIHARICKIMDVYDALVTRRSYKKAMVPFDALTLMKTQMSYEFDEKLLDLFIKLMGPDEW